MKWKDLIIVALTVICVTLTMSTSCVRQHNKTLENNINALRDTVEYIQLQNGNIMSEKQSLILSNKELSNYLDISKSEIRDLQRRLDSKIAQITELKGSINVDTIRCIDSVYVHDSVRYVDFRFKDDWINVYGTTSSNGTLLNNISISTPLTVGLTEDNKYFVTSPNPYLHITDINSAVVETKQSKPKHWNVGLQVGFGAQYDVISRQFGVGPYVGLGLSYGFSF